MPALIIHGGAGSARTRAARDEIRTSLAGIARAAWSMVLDGAPALDVAVEAAKLLEDDPLFNAGLGSKLQSDGAARLSAALMDGEHECFSGVINVEGLLNPIQLCRHLQTARDRVLAGEGALRLARELGLPEGDVITDAARENWERALEGETGTIGAVIRDQSGHIAAATSTGGRGMEAVGRVSDSATVAGNFASPSGGASCTGIGEDIVDGALAARLVAALDAGIPLNEATKGLEAKMHIRDWKAGIIALDARDQWSAMHTTQVMYWTAIDLDGLHQFHFPELP